MTKEMKKLLNAAALIVEFVVFAAFAFSTGLLYYNLKHPAPVAPGQQQYDNDFVPLILLILLAAGACAFGLAFAVHFAFWLAARSKAKREAANRFA